VRPVGAGDASALAALHALAFPPAQAWSADAFGRLFALPGVFGVIADGEGLALFRAVADEAEILTLAVIPPARRRGLGAALLEAGLAGAAARGAQACFLEVAAGNEAARGLYAAAGFAEVGRRPGYYEDGADALVLRRALSAP
jgi:[ribosomal protein S18]-alanine N-acetyltransferase